MKRHISRVLVLVLLGMLISCGGGGGDDDSATGGGSPSAPIDGDPGNGGGGDTGNGGGGDPGNGGGDPGNGGGGDPGNGGGGDPGNGGGGDPGPLPSGAHVEESDAAVTFTGEWTQSNSDFGWSGGTAVQSTAAGATVSFKFNGTSVRWLGGRGRRAGKALVTVDDGPATVVDLFARPNDEIRTPALTIYGLTDGPHVLTIEVTGDKHRDALSNVVVVDAFDVQPEIMSHFQEADPGSESACATRCVKFSAGWEETFSTARLKWSAGGITNVPDPQINAKVTQTMGEIATVQFRGTSIRWIGYIGPDAGIALVKVDGGPPTEVDLYAPSFKVQQVVFTANGLADEPHTLTIEATGRKNAASTAAKVFVDAFDVTHPGRRYEQNYTPRDPTDPVKLTYTGLWNRHHDGRVWTEGRASASDEPGATVTFHFTGTSVSWIGAAKASLGRANVYLDGVLQKGFNPVNLRQVGSEAYQRTIYRVDGLPDGPHQLMIEHAGMGGYIVVDAFDVHPETGGGTPQPEG
jgi:hypothetical protein